MVRRCRTNGPSSSIHISAREQAALLRRDLPLLIQPLLSGLSLPTRTTEDFHDDIANL